MNINPKARRRISFTPIMLSISTLTQLPNLSGQSIVLITNSFAINASFQALKRPEKIYRAIYLGTPTNSRI